MLAGRNADKLARIRDSVAGEGAAPGLIAAEAQNEAEVAAMVANAQVVLNLAGPFSECHGDHIVGACARAGIHRHLGRFHAVRVLNS